MASTRESKYELLRIIAILLITIYHFCLHTASDYIMEMPTQNALVEIFFHQGGKIGVDLFILLTGYFQVTKTFRSRKLCNLELQIWFWCAIGLIAYVVLILVGQESFQVKFAIKAVFPITTNAYWFMTAYVGLYALSPFLNLLLRKLKLKGKLVLIVVLFLTQSIFPTFFSSREWVNNLTLFIFLYVMGATFRTHEEEIKDKVTKARTIELSIIGIGVTFVGGVHYMLLPKTDFLRLKGILTTLRANLVHLFCSRRWDCL